MASDRYTPQQLADMARRLDECIEVSALCMDLALAGEQHRRALVDGCAPGGTWNPGAGDAPQAGLGSPGRLKP